LAAGVFANFLFGLIFFVLLVLFFSLSYVPSGVNFNVYSPIVASPNLLDDLNENAFNLTTIDLANRTLYYDEENLQLNNLGVLKKINGDEINKYSDLKSSLEELNSGEIVVAEIEISEETKEYSLILSANPENSSNVLIGLGNLQVPQETIKQKVLGFFVSYKNPAINYIPRFESADFFYNLFWWIMVINFLVALFNMLPISILDGGRFFYLTIVSIFKSEKVAEKTFKIMGKIILLMFLLMMFFWLFNLVF
jgi:membrane-associated protease RseP (regulator of RpoE activity)